MSDTEPVVERMHMQHVKSIVNKMQLQLQKREEYSLHLKVIRPWGWYNSINQSDCFKVKRIQVNLGAFQLAKTPTPR